MDGFTRRNPFMELDDLQNRLATPLRPRAVRKDVGKEDAMTVAEWPPWCTSPRTTRSTHQGRVARGQERGREESKK